MDVNAVRVAVAAAVNTGVTGLPLTCYPYVPSDGPAPFAYVQVENIVYDRAMSGGSVELILSVMVMASRADDQTSQEQVDAFISTEGDSSIKSAIEAANGEPGEYALDGAAHFVHVTGTDGAPRWFEWGDGTKYHGVGLRVRVLGEA